MQEWVFGKDKMLDEVVPFVAMVLMEGCTIALTITAKSAMELGMNQFVFVAYSNALSSLLLLPYSSVFHRERMRQIFNFKLLSRFFILGLFGVTLAQNVALTGLHYSSPVVVCAMGLLLPTFQFFLALLLRKTSLDWGRPSSKIKLVATLVSIVGATIVAIYEGPSIIQRSLFHPRLLLGTTSSPLLVFVSTTQHWVFGSVLLACATFSLAVWGIIQVATFKKFPDMMVIVTGFTVFGTLQTAIVDLIAERDLSAWRLHLDLELAIIVLTAIFGTLVRSRVQAWCMSMKGPVYVSLFKPFGIFWACLIGLSLFGSSLHYGSVMGTMVVGMGYYAQLWGSTKADEEKKDPDYDDKDDCNSTTRDYSSDLHSPLLLPEDERV